MQDDDRIDTDLQIRMLEKRLTELKGEGAGRGKSGGGKIAPLEGAEMSRAVEGWVRTLKASKSRPFNKRERLGDPG